ncbi:MAG: hypothetical protein AAGF86_20325, partial [Pseudomonadota bacterium]
MSGWIVFILILLSLYGLAYLMRTDPKRRRTHDLPQLKDRPLVWPARLMIFGPGAYLIAIGHWSGLSIWAGAITTLGWMMITTSPDTYAKSGAILREEWVRVSARGKELSSQRLI